MEKVHRSVNQKTEGEDLDDLLQEVGGTGLRHWAGRINEEFLDELKYRHFYRTIREMRDNDPIVGSVLYAIKSILAQVDVDVVPFDDSEESKADAEFLEGCMFDMSHSWRAMQEQILTFIEYGYSYHEIVYKKRVGTVNTKGESSKFNDGKIGWRKISPRSQDTIDTWAIEPDGGISGAHQYLYQSQAPNKETGYIFLPIGKCLLFRSSRTKNNPEGLSLLRNAVRPWLFKKRAEEIEGIGMERDLGGLPLMRVPSRILNTTNPTAEELEVRNRCEEILVNIRNDEQAGVMLPSDVDRNGNNLYDFQLITAGGQKQFSTNEIITRYDQRIAMVLLADFVLLGHETVGSFALSDSKTDVFGSTLGAFTDEIGDIFNQHAIPRLFAINGKLSGRLPRIRYKDIETQDLKVLGTYIKELAASGMPLFPDKNLEQMLRDAGSLPDPDGTATVGGESGAPGVDAASTTLGGFEG